MGAKDTREKYEKMYGKGGYVPHEYDDPGKEGPLERAALGIFKVIDELHPSGPDRNEDIKQEGDKEPGWLATLFGVGK